MIFAIGIDEKGNSLIFVTVPGCKLAVSLGLHVNVCGMTGEKRKERHTWSGYAPTVTVLFPKDNFLRGDSSRKVQHQQQRKPRKKTKPPALTKKHKKKRRRGPRRPQKPIPPAVPQGNLTMPASVSLPVEMPHIRSVVALPQFPIATFNVVGVLNLSNYLVCWMKCLAPDAGFYICNQ